jgi:hypothetical protein
MNRQFHLRAVAFLQAMLLLATLVIPALAAAATITTDLWVYADGDTVTVTGVDYGPTEVVDFVTTDPDGLVVDTGSTTTDELGNLTYAFVLNVTVSGIYITTGTGEASGLVASVQFDPPKKWDLDVNVSPASLVVTVGSITVSGTLALSGSDCTAPISPVGQSIAITVAKDGGAFLAAGSATTTTGGAYSFSYSPAAKGAYQFKASVGTVSSCTSTQTGASSTVNALGRASTISINCAPATITNAVGSTSTCTATVSDTQIGGVSTVPSGTVSWNGPAPANQFLTSTCTLLAGTCQVVYDPNNSIGTRPLSAAYDGDSVHATSNSNTFNLVVTAPATDTTPPVIAAHADVTVQATSAAGATVIYTSPATSDAVDGAGTATCSPASGTVFALGNTTVTCNATDAAGNTAIPTTFVVHVVDTTGPVIAAHSDVTTEATSAAGANATYISPATSDAVDGAGTATFTPASGTIIAVDVYTTVTCNATDAAGNAAVSTTFTVHVVDTTAPVIAAHGNETVEATSAAGANATYTSPATSDAVDGPGTATCSPASGTLFALDVATTVTCNVTDAHNNAATATTFTVTVVDTTAPVIAAHGNETAEATSALGAIVTYTSPATSDAVDGAGTATCSPASGTTFALDLYTTVTCNATDAHGNVATATTFTVHVVDTTAPVIAAHADVNAPATGLTGAIVTYTSPATSDAVDGAGTATCTPASGSLFAIGSTTVTCTATDAHGNVATPTTFVVHVLYQVYGFYTPVDMNDVLNTVKSGQTVPLKFEIFAGSTEVTSTSAIKGFKATQVTCGVFDDLVVDQIEMTTSGGTSLRYDTTGGQFIQNWQTPKNSAGLCFVVTMTAQDGTSLNADFQLK